MESNLQRLNDASVKTHQCRFCGTPLEHMLVDLGMQPLCESYVAPEKLDTMEPFFPVKAFVCESCFLVQVLDMVGGEDIYSHYAYFSSYSDSWLAHIKDYVDMIVTRRGLGADTQVMEIASNDGYLLQFLKAKGIPVLGIEPAANIAEVAIEKGIPTLTKFFGHATAKALVEEGKTADLLIANNVFGHVPDINDFVSGMKALLSPYGIITVEIPHLICTIEGNQFDQIYQEHYSYYSLTTAEKIFAAHGLTMFDVDEIPTHGGSLRYYVRHQENSALPVLSSVDNLRQRESDMGYVQLDVYREFGERVKETKRKLLEFLVRAKREGKQVVGYGAPGKGTTLLNYCGVREDFVDYTVDRNPYKQGTYLPGVRIPIFGPEKINETRPDYILILPWNLKDELSEQLAYARDWGAKFVVPIPELEVF